MISKRFRPVLVDGTPVGLQFTCPGCKSEHWIAFDKHDPIWTFDGDWENPTCAPSVKITFPGSVCHFFLTKGQLVYQSDSTHALAGQTVDVPPFEE